MSLRNFILCCPIHGNRRTTTADDVISEEALRSTRSEVLFSTKRVRVLATPQARAFSDRAKDLLPASSKSCLIYKFTCDCASTYVGRTCQSLNERIKHLPNRLFEQGSKTKKTATDSAITRHVCEHPACLEKSPRERFKIVAMALISGISVCLKHYTLRRMIRIFAHRKSMSAC